MTDSVGSDGHEASRRGRSRKTAVETAPEASKSKTARSRKIDTAAEPTEAEPSTKKPRKATAIAKVKAVGHAGNARTTRSAKPKVELVSTATKSNKAASASETVAPLADHDLTVANSGGFITIEHAISCSTYKGKGSALGKALKAAFPKSTIEINPVKPRAASFDIRVKKSPSDDWTTVWNGHSMGPPRNLKFIDVEKAVDLVTCYFDGQTAES
ncbi:hypothetical protein BATDEDRAFT_84631 [Batrachochytrium dendrobatidis JAM81]|uniref:Selenoprotein H n=2 Tax=Batrachochytrium dendrobatidis TaxID=109871 RepID=F4NTE3_BATDJ|nr:uncharacterized protein BATDEDRAFT_84631 [Batrachochytrium dendrobatidis JAM81]EGF83100.1 hypothetical protein BATDEDRAFT_84631 [Batrachochytrium dendrobatidis JAM81]OAJ36174.1 hypothetical protein BDEG_20376 [Batrachochytrium dendrobatidis JEL423]|eukprot:XP_006675982.1 hypothetical protein BATDEDRAFT_84631 [Batrachochytrium dendrobatidis JAM81]